MAEKRLINADLKIFLLFAVLVTAVFAPMMRGLYFDPDLLPFHMFSYALLFIVVFDILVKKEGDFALRGMDYSVIALIAAYLISYYNAVYLRGALRDILIYVNFFILYLVSWRAIQKEQDINRVIVFLYVSGVIVSFIGLAAATGVFDFPGAFENNTILSVFQYKNAFGIFTVMGLFLALGMWLSAETIITKTFHAIIIYLFAISLLASQSRASWAIYLLLATIVSFLLREEIKKLFYIHVFYIGSAIITSRWFIPAIIKHESTKALIVLGAGMLVTAIFQILYDSLAGLINKIPENYKKIVTVGGIAYLLIVALIYFTYLNSAVPTVAGKLASAEIASRAATIGGYDASFEIRKDYIKDGIKIGIDYFPFGAGGEGWNTLYHRYQTFMYWTTEPHSHPIKIWIEAGIIGIIAYLALWFFAFKDAVISLGNISAGGIQKKYFFLLAALFSLFLHSIFDFELSLPGMLFYTAIAFGTIRGTYAVTYKTKKELPYKVLIPACIILISVFYPFYQTASNFNTAGIYGSLGAKALRENNFSQAIAYYKNAHQLDATNHTYITDLAQIYTLLGLENGDYSLVAEGKKYAKLALTLNPYDIRIQGRLVNLFILQKDYAFAVGTAENFLNIAPLDMDAYELTAQAYFSSLQNALINHDNVLKEKYLQKIGDLQNKINTLAQRPRRSGDFWQGRKVTPTELTEVIFAKAQVVKGNYQWADEIFKKYENNKSLKDEVRIWRLVIKAKLGGQIKCSPNEEKIVKSITQYL